MLLDLHTGYRLRRKGENWQASSALSFEKINLKKKINRLLKPPPWFLKKLLSSLQDPKSHPDLHRFLRFVIGFDSVDDESKPENPLFDRDVTTPDRWTDDENPPYSYYIYYMYANMTILNHFRQVHVTLISQLGKKDTSIT